MNIRGELLPCDWSMRRLEVGGISTSTTSDYTTRDLGFGESPGPLFNPLLHHLTPAPNPTQVTGNTLAKMSVPQGFSVDLIAAEPRIHQPMAFTFDAQGRLWVVEGHSYPTKRPAEKGLIECSSSRIRTTTAPSKSEKCY